MGGGGVGGGALAPIGPVACKPWNVNEPVMSLLNYYLATPANTFSIGKAYLTQQILLPDLHLTTMIYLIVTE